MDNSVQRLQPEPALPAALQVPRDRARPRERRRREERETESDKQPEPRSPNTEGTGQTLDVTA